MKTNFKILKLITLLCLLAISCAPPPPPMSGCNTSNTPFQTLYDSIMDISDYTNLVAFDTEIHQYTFVMDHSGEICSFGYQSLPTTVGFPYTIELLDGSNKVIFSQDFKFAVANTLYVSVDPIAITGGRPYTLRRIIFLNKMNDKLENLIGRVVIKDGSLMSFPLKAGNMTITGSIFYQNGTTLVNAGIPFIDFAFN